MKKYHKILIMVLALFALLWFVLNQLIHSIFNLTLNEPHIK